ncbi:hypothetical protein [Streptomyces uncialis]|uniref:Uncharacterized protein n=1 Tax=Streptomyces uncialis TaxID=1048205 RepID=A0A1Q4UY01_9ACTN|nr:hypothetical protein [Streptomyces uncialis]OKH90467.1 hypothetical protein AB852_35460 [Streptomyces uncialis]
MGMADNGDQRHMRRMTLDYSYEQLNGLLTTLQIEKERCEEGARKATHSNDALGFRMMAQWTGEHIDALRTAWEGGEPLEERGESRGVTVTGIQSAGTVYVFGDDAETCVRFEERNENGGDR